MRNKGLKIIYNKEEYEFLLKKLKTFTLSELADNSQIESIIIFGSYATKNYTSESDLDLCFLFKQRTIRSLEVEIHDKILDLSKELDLIIQCIYIYPEKIHNWDETLIEDILRKGILIYGSNKYKTIFHTKSFRKTEELKTNQ